MRLVLDTTILVAALRSGRGASRQLLVGAMEKRFVLLMSVPLMIEYESVLMRAEHREAAGLSSKEMLVILDAVAAVAEPVRLSFLWRPLLTDPNDDMVMETAANGQADYLATFNRRDFAAAGLKLGCRVDLPGNILRELRRKP
jgi:putative PIN family toxin of toxin-antitoxin system